MDVPRLTVGLEERLVHAGLLNLLRVVKGFGNLESSPGIHNGKVVRYKRLSRNAA
jgi:hypothetical protein